MALAALAAAAVDEWMALVAAHDEGPGLGAAHDEEGPGLVVAKSQAKRLRTEALHRTTVAAKRETAESGLSR